MKQLIVAQLVQLVKKTNIKNTKVFFLYILYTNKNQYSLIKNIDSSLEKAVQFILETTNINI